MQWQTAPARWRVLFGKVAEKYRAGGRMQTEYADILNRPVIAEWIAEKPGRTHSPL